jgi:hypothetical protein
MRRALFFLLTLVLCPAEKLVAQDSTRLYGHPPNDEFIRIIRQVPSYGGKWVGAGGCLHGSVANMSDSSKLVDILVEFVSRERAPFLHCAGSNYGITIEKAKYSYAQLTEWERQLMGWTHLSGIGVDEMKNRIHVGVPTVSDIEVARRAVVRLRIPVDAVTIVQEGVVQDLGDTVGCLAPCSS